MVDHPNAPDAPGREQLMARDMEGFLSNFADDVGRTGGDNALSGVRRGKDELTEWFRAWDEKTGARTRSNRSTSWPTTGTWSYSCGPKLSGRALR